MAKRLNVKDIDTWCDDLSVGEEILLSGTVYTARDAVHKKFFQILECGEELPIDIRGAAIYYAGPTPKKEGLAIGSCGPTTSSRMDSFTPRLLDLGLKCMIGKGERSADVVSSIVKNKAVYLCAIGGAGALAARAIKECEVIAFEELGCESLKRIVFEDFPLIVAINSRGENIFDRNGK